MVGLVALVLLLATVKGVWFTLHVLGYVLLIAVMLWPLGFLIGGVPAGIWRQERRRMMVRRAPTPTRGGR